MSMEPPSLPVCPDTSPPADTAPDNAVTGIRRQASAIIEAVLSAPAPEEAGIRERLRQHLAAHPGHPETALAEHLKALRSVRSLPGGAAMAFAAAVEPSTESQPGTPAPAERASRIQAILKDRMLLTAFQPIYEISTGSVTGVEAFTRFATEGATDADYWFAEAAEAKLGSELEFTALESALAAAVDLPSHLYVALKLSPAICLDPLLPGLLEESTLAPNRMVLELTEAMTEEQPAALATALAPLRQRGVRLAFDHIGTYINSLSHVRQLKPEIIKLDRNLIAGIDTDPLRHAFGDAMVSFAEQLGAALIAEGIETHEELTTITALGATAAQGYLLERPTTRREDWARWNHPAPTTRTDTSSSLASIWF